MSDLTLIKQGEVRGPGHVPRGVFEGRCIQVLVCFGPAASLPMRPPAPVGQNSLIVQETVLAHR